jgi:opacity protein-like surface antigen
MPILSIVIIFYYVLMFRPASSLNDQPGGVVAACQSSNGSQPAFSGGAGMDFLVNRNITLHATYEYNYPQVGDGLSFQENVALLSISFQM